MKKISIFFYLLYIGTVSGSFLGKKPQKRPEELLFDYPSSGDQKIGYTPINKMDQIIRLIQIAVEQEIQKRKITSLRLDEKLLEDYDSTFAHLSWRPYHTHFVRVIDSLIQRYIQEGMLDRVQTHPLYIMQDLEKTNQDGVSWHKRLIDADKKDSDEAAAFQKKYPMN